MRIADPKRPGQDAEKNFYQLYKWMYQTAEQLNMMMEQLERNNVLDLQAGFGTSAEQGLLSETVSETKETLLSIQGSQMSQAEQIGQIQTQLGGFSILAGVAEMPFGSGATSLEIAFEQPFASAPVVVTSQVFDQTNITVPNRITTTTGFTAVLSGGFSTSGSRTFHWIAVGKKED